jgi:hypothetical protein
MNKRTQAYLAHPENRMTICRANRLLFGAKEGQGWLATEARAEEYRWLALAEDHDLTAHF